MMRLAARYLVCACLLFSISQSAAADDVAKLIKDLENPDINVRAKALNELARKGPAAAEAVPALSKLMLLGDDETQWQTARVLATIGSAADAAVPSLVKGLKDKDPLVRGYSVYALGEIGAQVAVPEMVKLAVEETNRTVRREALEALKKLDAPEEVTLPLFVKALEAAEPAAVMSAVEGLAEAGKDVVPRLKNALKHENACYWACVVLGAIGKDAEGAVPELTEVLKHKEPECRIEAMLALAEIGEGGKPAAAAVTNVLENDAYQGVKYVAAYALGSLGDASVLPALKKAFESGDELMKVSAGPSILTLGSTDEALQEQIVAALVAGLKSENDTVRGLAARGFGATDIPDELANSALLNRLVEELDEGTIAQIVDAVAQQGKKAVPRVIRGLKEDKIKRYALEVVLRMGPDAAETVPAIIEVMDGADAELMTEAHFALGAVGASAKAAVPKLIANLGSKNESVRHSACYALGKIGAAATDATPQLLEASERGDEFMKVASLWALLRIHPGDKQIAEFAIPRLIKALDHPRAEARAEIAGALGDLGPMALAAADKLREMARADESDGVRAAATEALVKIRDPSGSK